MTARYSEDCRPLNCGRSQTAPTVVQFKFIHTFCDSAYNLILHVAILLEILFEGGKSKAF
jgi:hypothetical protein